MTLNFIIAQIAGVIALIALTLSFQKNNKKTLLKYQMLSSLLYAIQYLFLKANTGCILNLICMLRNFVFYKYNNNKIPVYWLVLVLIMIIFSTMVTYIGDVVLLPMLAIIFFSVAMWNGDLKIIRFTEVISCILLIIYNIKVLAITGLIATTVEMSGALIAIYKFDIKKYKS